MDVFNAAFETMDYLCGRPTFAREQPGPFSVRADPARPVWTHANVGAGALVTTPFPGCDTIYATFQYAVAKNGSRPAVGTRRLLKARRAPRRAQCATSCGVRAQDAPPAVSGSHAACRAPLRRSVFIARARAIVLRWRNKPCTPVPWSHLASVG